MQTLEFAIAVLFLSYVLLVGTAVIVQGPKGVVRINKFLFRSLRRTIAWVFDKVGDLFKAVARSIRP
jgi:hypothetical protein